MQNCDNTTFQFIDGGVTSPLGFTANGVHAGLKSSRTTNDTALIFSEKRCNTAAVFTTNRVKAECVKLTQKNLSDGYAQAAVVNVCYANACTGEEGMSNAVRQENAVAKALNIKPEDVIVCSTGIIGQQVPVQKVEEAMPVLVKGLSKENHKEARVAIMTTDTHYKECAIQFELPSADGNGSVKVTMGTMCKGSGMIHINMGTMLGFITTDCDISKEMLNKALHESILSTYNCVSVDGDTSTNDTLALMANGMAKNAPITSDSGKEGESFKIFKKALNMINTVMARKIGADGEGASRLVECFVKGAKNVEDARGLAKSIIGSNLVKAAMFGQDANCGRILCAMGYSGFDFNPDKTCVYFVSAENSDRYFEIDKQNIENIVDGNLFDLSKIEEKRIIEVVHNGVGLNFDEEKATKILNEEYVQILVTLEDGSSYGSAWGCDLTYDYVKINGDYRS